MATETAKLPLERCAQQVEEHPDSARAHYNLGLAHTQRGHVDRAERSYRKALEVDPDLVEAWVNLGGILLLKWDFERSLEASREALKRKKDLVLAHHNSGQACLYLGDADGVVRSSRRVIELDPDHAAAHYFLAVGLLANKQLNEAKVELSRAGALGHSPQPDFLRALNNAEQELAREQETSNGNNIGADAPDDSNRR